MAKGRRLKDRMYAGAGGASSLRQALAVTRRARPGASLVAVRRVVGTSFRRGRVLAAVLLGGLLLVQWRDPPPVEVLRTRSFDLYQNIKPREQPAESLVAVADIDERSLERYGQWPWPRTLVAQLVLALRAAGASAIGFDVVFAEGDRTSPEFASRFMAELDDATFDLLQTLPRNDAVLATQIEAAPVVLGQSVGSATAPAAESVGFPPPQQSMNIVGPVVDFLPRFPRLLRNLPELEAAAKGIGLFSLLPESDGIVRRVPAAISVDGEVFPTLTIELLRVATGSASIDVRASPEAGVTALRVHPFIVPTDRHGRFWVRFAPRDPRRYHSIVDILSGEVGAAELAGSIVLVGTSAAGLFDLRATPLESVVPGVDVHAQALDMILAGDFIQRPDWTRPAEWLAALVGGVLVIALVPSLGALAGLGLGLGAMTAIGALSWYLFADRGILFDASWPLLTGFTLLGTLFVARAMREQTEKRHIRSTFSQYLSPDVVKQLANSADRVRLGGDTREMTMLFCDIRGFTTISEEYKNDPQGLILLVNRLLTPLSNAVLEHRGTIDKYIGDCVMAFWNAPLADKSHRRNACAAALDMIAALHRVNRERAAHGAVAPMRIGIGINTGTVVVGNMGSDMRFDYSVLGDAVNLAARLEGQSKTYGVDIIVGEETARGSGDEFELLELDLIAVKGKSEGVRVFGLLGARGAHEGFRALREANAAMLAAYRRQAWDEAGARVREIQAMPAAPAAYLELMRKRIAKYRAEPPGDTWNGVYIATGK